ncbi:MAG: hypothetical protein AAB612_01560 [Patescibacteria group bacterium]
MRVLLLLAKFLVGLGLLVGVVFLISREGLLLWGQYTIQRDADRLRASAVNAKEYTTSCENTFPGIDSGNALSGLQIRFVDDHTYQVELVCAQHEQDPILLRTVSLPMFVTRMPGSSGLFFGVGKPIHTTMELGLWGRRYRITVGDTAALQKSTQQSTTRMQYPESNCAGWGYHCCDVVTQVPDGLPVAGVAQDCRNSCYSVCKSRPLVLSFRSDPQQKTGVQGEQTVNLTADNSILAFAAIVSAPDAALQKVVIDFGDGSNEEFTKDQITTTHTYTCTTSAVCSFSAKIIAFDIDGLQSPDLPTNTIKIVVQQR